MKLMISEYARFALLERDIRDSFTESISKSISEKRRREMAVERFLLSQMFGSDTRLLHNPDGAPYIDGLPGCLTVTHSGAHVAVAYDEIRRIGIDIESPRDALGRVARRFLTAEEYPVYSASVSLLLRAWTAKEAVYKAAGIKRLESGQIHLPPDPQSPVVTVPGRRFLLTYHTLGDELMAVATEIR